MSENTNRDVELLIAELDGFLNSIRCFLGYVRTYCAWVQKSDDIECSIKDYISEIESLGGKLISSYEANYDQIKELFNENIFLKLEKQGHVNLERVEWELIEYYGLTSTTINKNGPWNPIVSNKSRVLKFDLEESIISTVIIVSVDKYLVFTVLADNKTDK